MAGSLASINIKFFADLKDFSTKMQNSQRQIKKMGRSMKKMGGNLSVGLTAPMAAFAAVSLKNWNDQEKAIAQVNAGLKSTGNAVGYTSEQLQQMATDLQNNTLFGDEEILKGATAQLLTFTNISGQQFARTQQAALDLATRLDGDLK
ncbi:phage tail length tape measure family protein, partial [Candidatus Venteria ishoeyi]|uniref:phage tail length tape measure family protein n=1 Tax=Candidatus Venteria ishoeyi TaxID=1899563 RepID=UPI0011AFE9AA